MQKFEIAESGKKCELESMKLALFLVAIAVTAASIGAGPLETPMLSTEKVDTKEKADTKLLHVTLAKDQESEPTTKFSSDVSKISAFWKGKALKAGDKVRALWIAEDVGYDPLKDAKITEASVIAYKPDDDGIFSLARPPGGWPVGKYRLEVYVDDKLAEKVKFTIEPGVTVEVR